MSGFSILNDLLEADDPESFDVRHAAPVYDGSASVRTRKSAAGSRCPLTWNGGGAWTTDGPWLTSPHGSHSLRYVDVAPVEGELWIYYEYARADGAHELRLNKVRV